MSGNLLIEKVSFNNNLTELSHKLSMFNCNAGWIQGQTYRGPIANIRGGIKKKKLFFFFGKTPKF